MTMRAEHTVCMPYSTVPALCAPTYPVLLFVPLVPVLVHLIDIGRELLQGDDACVLCNWRRTVKTTHIFTHTNTVRMFLVGDFITYN